MKLTKAHVDLELKKIYNCDKNSFRWWHEKGHIVFNDRFSFLLLIKNYIFLLWMLFVTSSIVIRYLYPTAVLLWAGFIMIEIYEEVWANKYAKFKGKI